jgi:hypothetical protein
MKATLEMPIQTTTAGTNPAQRCNWRSVFISSLVIMLTLLLIPSLFGQGTTGSITGVVSDSSGALVAGANVTVVEVTTNAARTVKTSDAGTYTVTQLLPGQYSVKVDKPGF